MKKISKEKIISKIAGALALAFCLCFLSSCSFFVKDVHGDCNGDGAVNSMDSQIYLRHIKDEEIKIIEKNSDLNGDGHYNKQDHATLLEYLSGKSRPGSRFSKIFINNVNISNYTLVIPENATDFEKWTAEILSDGIYDLCEVRPEIINDSQNEQFYEILIGETSRKESSNVTTKENMFTVFSRFNKIIIKGDSFLVAGGVGYIFSLLDSSSAQWNSEGYVSIPTKDEPMEVKWEDPKRLFLFIGDGMGENHIRLATDENAFVKHTTTAPHHMDETSLDVFWPELFENVGNAFTLNYQLSTTDSAAGATALSTGYKTLNGALGMVPADLDGDGEENEFRSVQNVREAAALSGMSTAVLSTDKITGATPNAFLVHHTSRMEKDLLLEQQTALSLSHLACTYLWCSYDSDDALSELIDAVNECGENPNGFFIMSEEAMIDKYSEKMDFDNAARTVKRLNRSMAYTATYAYCHWDTVVILTADHETGGLEMDGDGVWSWTSNGEHTQRKVPVYALGKGTEIFDNTTCENIAIANFIFDAIKE